MQHISLYFDKYQDFEKELQGDKDLIAKSIFQLTKILLPVESIVESHGKITLKLTPGQRSLCLEKKEELVETLSKALKIKILRVG